MLATTRSRLLGGYSTEEWEPLSRPDHVLLILAALHQALVVAAVSHLLWCRRWPPYIVKNVPLVCVTGIAGAINLLGVVISFGFLEYDHPSLLANCFFQGLVTWTGAGFYYSAAVVRVYRNYQILIRHSADMIRPVWQMLLLQTPIWGATLALLSPEVARMDYDLNRCQGQARYVLLGAFNYAGLLLLGAIYLMWKMRNVRKQMNEYRVMMLSLGFLLSGVIALDVSAGGVAEDDTLTRRVALINNIVRSALLFWPVILTPMLKYGARDVGYAEQFSVGLTPTLTPAMLRASLADQLKVDELWLHFRKMANARMPPDLLDFYEAVMNRDKEEGYFERQAKTMDVIDTYVAENSPCQVEISSGCRERILASEVTRYNIFCEASGEVLKVMQETCQEAFQTSAAYGLLLRKAEKDEAELEALKKANMVPKARSAGFGFGSGDGPNASRSDRWTNSTISGRKNTPIDDARRVWLCYPLRKLKRSTGTTVSSRHQPKTGRNRASGSAANGASVSCVTGSQRRILGNRSDAASQHADGLRSPVDTVGCGHGSPLPWLTEEVKDIEMGDVSLGEDGDTRTPSNLSVSKENKTSRATHTLSPQADASPPDASPSSVSCPSSAKSQSELPAPAPTRRPPPAPWAPWRRQPERSIAPSLTSPADERWAEAARAERERQGVATEEAFEDMPPRVVPSSSSMESVVLLMPPSPATPLYWDSVHGFDREGAPEPRRSEPDSGFSSLESGEAFVSCAAFSAATGYVPSSGFVPTSNLLSVAVAKEQAERKRAEAEERASRRLPTIGLSAVSMEEEGEEEEWEEEGGEEEEGEEEEGEEEEDKDVKVTAGKSAGESMASPGSSAGCTERMESSVTSWSSVGGSGRGSIVERAAMEESSRLSQAEALGDPPGSEQQPLVPFTQVAVEAPPAAPQQSAGEKLESGLMSPRGPAPVALPLSSSSSPPASASQMSPCTVVPIEAPPVPSPAAAAAAAAPALVTTPLSSPSPLSPLLEVTPSPSPPMATITREESPRPPSQPASYAVAMAAEVSNGYGEDGASVEEILSGASTPLARLNHTMVDCPPPVLTPPVQSAPAFSPPVDKYRRPLTPPSAAAAMLPEGKAPLRKEARERAPRNRNVVAAETQAQTAWVPQPAVVTQGMKGAGPARAQPARAPAWGQTPPVSELRPACHELPSLLPVRLSCTPPPHLAEQPQPSTASPPPRTPPMPPPLLPLNLVAIGPPSHLMFAPPSPSGRSASVSPSSVRSSPLLMRPPMASSSLPPAVPPGRDIAPSGAGIPLVWSWSDSTLSGCSRSGGGGCGASSVSASVVSELASPLVGMRFVGADSGGDGGSVKDGLRSRSGSGSGVLGVSEVPLMGVRGSPPLPAVGRLGEDDAAVAGAVAGAASGVVGAAANAESGLEGGVGGRQGKRPRRFFFP